MRPILERGFDVPRSVKFLLDAAYNHGRRVKIVFSGEGPLDSEPTDCFTLVYGVQPHGFNSQANLRDFRKALDGYNQVAIKKIRLNLTPKEMKALQAFGAEVQKGEHVVHNDAGELVVRSRLEGHVLAVPQFGKGRIPRAVLRSIIGTHDADAAREKARAQLSLYAPGEITPFLGPEGRNREYHFDEETVRHNPLVRFYNGKDYAVLMHYGDAFRIIQGTHPARANFVDFFPSDATKKDDGFLFTSKIRLKAFAADLRAYNGRTKSKIQIELTEGQMTALRQKDAELQVGNHLLRHENGVLHVYEKPK